MQLDSLRATTETKEITYRIAYGLRLTDMHRWGLYVSNPRNIRETEHPFPEPAMFLINPEGQVQVAEYSNSPFCRPDLRIMIEGKFCLLLFSLAASACCASICCALQLQCCASLHQFGGLTCMCFKQQPLCRGLVLCVRPAMCVVHLHCV